MLAIQFLLVSASLLQVVHSRSLPFKTVSVNNVVVPKVKSDFTKDNVASQWAPGHPKEWGSEDFSYQFGEPDPEGAFGAAITDDERYLTLFNGSHVEFVDLNSNSTSLIFKPEVTDGVILSNFVVRNAADGGYDVFTSTGRSIYDSPATTSRHHVSADLKKVNPPVVYQGAVGAISKNDQAITSTGTIYDLKATTNTSVATLEGQPGLTDYSFSPDGAYLATVSWIQQTADLWNATSGQKVFQFPATNTQNWVARFSPDGKYIAFVLGGGFSSVRIYSLGDLKAAPVEINGFNDWPRNIEWSPDSKQIAIGDVGRLQVFNFPSKEIVQAWQVDFDVNVYSTTDIHWFEGGKLTFQFRYWTYLYDLESNTKRLWTPRVSDRVWGGTRLTLLKKKGYAVIQDGDSTVRFYKL